MIIRIDILFHEMTIQVLYFNFGFEKNKRGTTAFG